VLREGALLQYDTPLALLGRPADPFVARLLGADDALRRLSLLPVSLAAEPYSAPTPQPPSLEGKRESDSPLLEGEGLGVRVEGLPEPLDPADTLRHALTRLLSEGREALPVTGGGRLTLDSVRAVAASDPAAPDEPEA
jgi:ABC-type proline/glycine betaine transport system ATPase subunit